MRRRYKSSAADNELLQTFLMKLFAGDDVRIKFRTKDHQYFSGFWCWDMTQMHHVHRTKKNIRELYPVEAEYTAYVDSMPHRIFRWKDVVKQLKRFQENEVE